MHLDAAGRDRIEEVRSRSPVNPASALTVLLDFWLARTLTRRGIGTLHAAAFQTHNHRVLALGPSGAGKSTIAAAVLADCGRVVSDDLVLAGIGREDEIEIVPSRLECNFRPNTVPTLPDALRSRLRTWTDGEQVVWSLGRDQAVDRFVDSLTPNTIWAISVDRRLHTSRKERITQAAALAALLGSISILFLSPRFPAERMALMPVLSRLASTCAGYRIRLGTDLISHPKDALRRLLDEDSTGV
jgi:hypothetical protein